MTKLSGSLSTASINQGKPSGKKPVNKQTRTLIGGALALATLLTVPGRVMAAAPGPSEPFLLLLKGVYQPVVNGPNLGLPGVNLNDGSYITTEIHAVTTLPSISSQDNAVLGHFYAQFGTGSLAVYDLPGGTIEMQFTSGNFPTAIPDGQNGLYLEGTFELTIVAATGKYSSYVGGHNHMVDRLHLLASGRYDENCFCIISIPSSLPLWWPSD